MKIPDEKKCFSIMNRYNMMEHIVHHSIMVRAVADSICRHLLAAFPDLDVRLVNSAALLHDITKTRSFSTGEKHSETGCEVLQQLGFPETGDIIRQHVILDVYEKTPPITEAEVVNYSDKRVLHDRVVHLDERLEYIYENYVTDEKHKEEFQEMWENTRMLENKIFRYLKLQPFDLQKLNTQKNGQK